MPVWVMIHRLIDKTFWVSVAFGVLALETSAMGFIYKSSCAVILKPPSCSAFCYLNPLDVLKIERYCLLLLPAKSVRLLFKDASA